MELQGAVVIGFDNLILNGPGPPQGQAANDFSVTVPGDEKVLQVQVRKAFELFDKALRTDGHMKAGILLAKFNISHQLFCILQPKWGNFNSGKRAGGPRATAHAEPQQKTFGIDSSAARSAASVGGE